MVRGMQNEFLIEDIIWKTSFFPFFNILIDWKKIHIYILMRVIRFSIYVIS